MTRHSTGAPVLREGLPQSRHPATAVPGPPPSPRPARAISAPSGAGTCA